MSEETQAPAPGEVAPPPPYSPPPVPEPVPEAPPVYTEAPPIVAETSEEPAPEVVAAPVEPPPLSQAEIQAAALKAATDIAEAAIPAVVVNAETGGLVAAVEAGAAAGEPIVEAEAPVLAGAEWDALKAWARREIFLAQSGASHQTRSIVNP